MKKLFLLLLLVILLVLGIWRFSGAGGDQTGVEETLESKDLRISGISGYETDALEDERTAGIKMLELTASNGTSRFEIDVYSGVERDFAGSFIRDRKTEINSIYTDKPAPYEGIPEKEVDCEEGFGVNVTQQEGNYTLYSLYADEDYGIGACSQDTAEYAVELVIGYCGESRYLFESRSFVEAGSDQDHPRVGCRNQK